MYDTQPYNEFETQERFPYESLNKLHGLGRDHELRKVLFLDIDGVLNDEGPKREAGTVIDDACVERVARIVEATGAKIILSSSWRRAWWDYVASGYETCGRPHDDEHLRTLKDALDRHGLEVYGVTPDSGTGPDARPFEIRSWLKYKPRVESFVILDDDDFWTFGWMTPFFVRTQTPTEETDWLGIPQCVRGLEDPHVEQAIQILNAVNYISPESKRREEYDRLWHARREQQERERQEREQQEHERQACENTEHLEPEGEKTASEQ